MLSTKYRRAANSTGTAGAYSKSETARTVKLSAGYSVFAVSESDLRKFHKTNIRCTQAPEHLVSFFTKVPDAIRTHTTRFRRPRLYPVKLREQIVAEGIGPSTFRVSAGCSDR